MIRTWSLLLLSAGLMAFSSAKIYGQYVVTFPVVQADLLEANGGPDHQAGLGTVIQLGGAVPATGGTPPYQYRWFPGIGLSDSTLPNPTLTVDTTRTYTLTVTDADSCTAAVQILVDMLIGVLGQPGRWNMPSVFPNPLTGDILWIEWREPPSGPYTLTLFSLTGKQVWCKSGTGQTFKVNLDGGTLPAGVYTLWVVADEEGYHQKIIVL